MDGAQDLSIFSMLMCGLLLFIPLAAVGYFKLGITKNLLVSTVRMVVQLVLIGFFLEYIFRYNNWIINLLWFLVMITAAVFSVIKNSDLKVSRFVVPVLLSFVIANFFVVLYFNYFIVNLNFILDAKYMIAIGGMVLGNSLRSNVIGLGDFYKVLRKEEQLYFYKLSLGATHYEALLVFAKKSFVSALNPTIATMVTMGIVSLPGMMTGQILGGSVPLVAIKYQIAIMVAILASTVLSIALSILFTVRFSFEKSGVLKKDIFRS
ncbi:MAG: ABC transporter permease [Paludibacter sp.]